MDPLDCDILFASYTKKQLGSFSKKYNEHWSLHFIIDAHAQLSIDDQHYTLEGSWLWAGFPGPLFTQNAGTELPQAHYRAALSGSSLDTWLDQGLWPRTPLPIHNVALLSERFEQLLQVLQGSTDLHKRQRAHAVEGILLETWSQQQQAPLPKQELWLERCCEILRKDCMNMRINYQHLANQLYIPLPPLRRRFRQAMGQAMHGYVLDQRCQLAQKLLLSSEDSLQ